MQKKILVPTDFSTNALHAATYAAELASQKQYVLTLYHCYSARASMLSEAQLSSDALEDLQVPPADILIEELKYHFQKEFPALTINTICERGLLTDAIHRQVERNGIDLIVMGTAGQSNKGPLFWGSNTNKITTKASVPVLAIPPGIATPSFDHVAMLTNYQLAELETLQHFLDLFGDIPKLDVIHISQPNSKPEEDTKKLAAWQLLAAEIKGLGTLQSTLQTVDPEQEQLDTIPEVIEALVLDKNVDILLITKTRKSFYQRLFNPSVSSALTLRPTKPLFFDHSN